MEASAVEAISPRQVDNIDREIGRRIRELRIIAGLTQEKLGDRLGQTFQQVQKYERGQNRVSGSRLVKMARALGVSVASLIPDDDTAVAYEPHPGVTALLATRSGQRLLTAAAALRPEHLAAISDLACAIVGSSDVQ